MRGSNLMPTNRDNAKIVVMTDGLLIAMMIANITIPDAALLIIDEVHELSLPNKVILGLLMAILQCQPDISVILMLATWDAPSLKAHFATFHPIQIHVAGATQKLDRVYLVEGTSSKFNYAWML
jgi:HrpA-like RNA helicase